MSDKERCLPIRITFRTARVLATVAARPGASNRVIAEMSGVSDQGQMSKLLRRLEKSELIDNHGDGQSKASPTPGISPTAVAASCTQWEVAARAPTCKPAHQRA